MTADMEKFMLAADADALSAGMLCLAHCGARPIHFLHSAAGVPNSEPLVDRRLGNNIGGTGALLMQLK